MKKIAIRNCCIGLILIIVFSAICSPIFTLESAQSISQKSEFESIYIKTKMDFIVPAPSYEQEKSIISDSDGAIKAITPYYETMSPVNVNGNMVDSVTTLLFPDAGKMEYTPYCTSRIIFGEKSYSGSDAIVDKRFIDEHICSLGDTVSIEIAGKTYQFTISGEAETNTLYDNGTIALILSESDYKQLIDAGIDYSAAYVCSDDYDQCKSYLFNQYKPLSRLKDRSAFDSEETYARHEENFNNADWSKEITDLSENYKLNGVKYDNIVSSGNTNIVIETIITVIFFVALNLIWLMNSKSATALKIFLTKKGGSISEISALYTRQIWIFAIAYVVVKMAEYTAIISYVNTDLLGNCILFAIIPCTAAIVVSALMNVISGIYVKKKYTFSHDREQKK